MATNKQMRSISFTSSVVLICFITVVLGVVAAPWLKRRLETEREAEYVAGVISDTVVAGINRVYVTNISEFNESDPVQDHSISAWEDFVKSVLAAAEIEMGNRNSSMIRVAVVEVVGNSGVSLCMEFYEPEVCVTKDEFDIRNFEGLCVVHGRSRAFSVHVK